MKKEVKKGIEKLEEKIKSMKDCDTKARILKDIENKKQNTVLK